MFKKFAIRAAAVLASLVAFVATPALSAEIDTSAASSSLFLTHTIPIKTSYSVNDFSKAVPMCPTMYVVWERGDSGVVSMYPADSDDDTSVEIEANTLIKQFTTNEVYGPFTSTKGYVRFVVDTVNASVQSSIKVLCSNFASTGGGGVLGSGPLATMLAYPTPEAGALWQADDNPAGDCSTGSTAGFTLCMYNGTSWEPAGVSSGIANVSDDASPTLGGDLDAATFDIVAPMGSVATHSSFPIMNITNPATLSMGAGVTWGSDQVAKDRPGGSEVDSRNHLMGWWYNKNGVNGTIQSACEPAWDWTHETNFHTTSGTADDKWVELNFDLFAPMYTSVPTGVSGTPTVGEYVQFSGGGYAKVGAWSGGTLTFNHSWGACAANAQTFTGLTSGATGTIASLTSIQSGTSAWTRMIQMEWDVPETAATKSTGVMQLSFATEPFSNAIRTLRMRNNRVGISTPDDLTRQLHVWRSDTANAVAIMEFDEAGISTNAGNADILELRHDYGTLANTHTLSRALHFLAPLNGGSVTIGRRHQIHIENQSAFGSTDSSVIMIEPQTGGDGGDGNVTFEGGGYNTGHLVMGGEGAAGLHAFVEGSGSTSRLRVTHAAVPTASSSGNLVSEIIAASTVALDTDAIASGACDTSDTGIAATGVLATDVLSWSFNADVSAITGYAPVTTGGLTIYAYPGSGTVSFKVCNPTASTITPSAAVSLNWNVVR